MATAKKAQADRTEHPPARARKRERGSAKKNLRELYARLEETMPGSEESKRVSARVVDAIG